MTESAMLRLLSLLLSDAARDKSPIPLMDEDRDPEALSSADMWTRRLKRKKNGLKFSPDLLAQWILTEKTYLSP